MVLLNLGQKRVFREFLYHFILVSKIVADYKSPNKSKEDEFTKFMLLKARLFDEKWAPKKWWRIHF